MGPPRYSVSRRRACILCAERKVRCDRASGRCATCAERGEKCRYPSNSPSKKSVHTANPGREPRQYESSTVSDGTVTSNSLHPGNEINRTANNESRFSVRPPQQSPDDDPGAPRYSKSVTKSQTDHSSDPDSIAGSIQTHEQTFDFTDLELDCPINADEIQNRWLSSYISGPGQTKKEYPPIIVNFMSRMMKSYVVAAVNDQGCPPWVHFSQVTSGKSTHLSTCLDLIRRFAKSSMRDPDDTLTTIQSEMSTIHQSMAKLDNMGKLTTFQAYLIYTMVLYFCVDGLPKPFLREAMINVQGLACASARGGLVCSRNQQSTRSKWEAWIASEAKRRTIYTMYMFDSILLSRDGLQNYLGVELRCLPAPGAKRLWQTQIRSQWDRLYDSHLTAWPDEDFRIDELWPLPPNLSEAAINERQRRLDLWLQGLDEYGTMVFAVTSCTHGC